MKNVSKLLYEKVIKEHAAKKFRKKYYWGVLDSWFIDMLLYIIFLDFVIVFLLVTFPPQDEKNLIYSHDVFKKIQSLKSKIFNC